MRFNITPVVMNLIIINLLFFFGSATLMGEKQVLLSLFYPTSAYFNPYQIVTHMFMHGDFGHIFFNLLMLFFFGPRIEALWGPRKFLTYYFICGFGAMILQLLAWSVEINMGVLDGNIRMLGASGAIMGVMMAFGIKFANERVQLLFPPIPIRAIYLVLFLISMDILGVFRPMQSGTAHFAHLGGALIGFLLMEYSGWFKRWKG